MTRQAGIVHNFPKNATFTRLPVGTTRTTAFSEWPVDSEAEVAAPAPAANHFGVEDPASPGGGAPAAADTDDGQNAGPAAGVQHLGAPAHHPSRKARLTANAKIGHQYSDPWGEGEEKVRKEKKGKGKEKHDSGADGGVGTDEGNKEGDAAERRPPAKKARKA